MKSLLRVIILLASLALLSLLSMKIPIPGSLSGGGKTDEKLVVITPHWDGIRNEFRRAFKEWYFDRTGKTIEFEWLDPGGTSDCIRYIRSEFKRNPDGIQADLFFGGGTDPYFELKREGLLEKVAVDSTILARIPSDIGGIGIYDPEGYWYGAVLSGFGIIYNKWVARWMHFDIPREWKDLADPRYASWVGLADPRNSGTMHIMFEIILQAYGWDNGWRILTGIAANARTFSKGANDVPKMVAKGDMAFGLAIDFYAWAEVSEAGEEKVGFILPQDLTVISADGIGMLRGAPNKRAAQLFIEFVLSEQGQKIWFLRKGAPEGPRNQELNRMTIYRDLYASHGNLSNIRQNPFDAQSTFRFDQELASRRWGIVNDIIGIGLIDHNDALRKAWVHASSAPETVTWARMPVSEQQCLQLADSVWNDAVAKNTVLLDWHAFYSKKYAALGGE